MIRYIPGVCLGLLLGGLTACAAQYGESAAVLERGYRASLHISDTLIWFSVPSPLRLPETAEVVVRVRDTQGQPVDGLAVVFAVEPAWTQQASLTPAEATTRHGEVRALFRASATGVVPIVARIDSATLKASITVAGRPSIGDGG